MKMESFVPEMGDVRYFPVGLFALFPLTSPGFVRVLFEVLKHRVKEQEERRFFQSLTLLCGDSINLARKLPPVQNLRPLDV
ncbi:hypothetical protein Tco_0184505 [Tanacetum coccineum]